MFEMALAPTVELTASLEDYLEAIYHIVAEKKAARSKDIADRLSVTCPSVTGALKCLSDKGLVNYAPYDIITMTEKGTDIAEGIVRRHEALRDFFTKVLLVDERTAEEGACRMEHTVPRVITSRLISLVDFLDSSSGSIEKWFDTLKGAVDSKGSDKVRGARGS